MIDSLVRLLPAARAGGCLERLGLSTHDYVLVTLHRPALVDDPARLGDVLDILAEVGRDHRVVFPAHPRTRARLAESGRLEDSTITFLDPLDYLDFIALEDGARLVVTDSGGVQEETSALGTPCITYRDSTERSITAELGTNVLVGVDPQALARACGALLSRSPARDVPRIPLWDGKAGPRAARAIVDFLDARG